ncbi:attachment protein [Pantoea agglomerans]|uniref:attachment protein n=1 Tax=Enterobacter agglomerans TaxID=549 RepID=UPI001654B577|nr:attachment protein [Pantoea agglomerans]
MKYLSLAVSAFFLALSSAYAADWASIYSGTGTGSATADYATEIVNGQNTIYYQVSDSSLKNACVEARASGKNTYDSVLSSFKPIYPDDEWQMTQGSDVITGNLGKSAKMYSATCTVSFSIEHRAVTKDPDPEQQTPEQICKAKPSIQNTFNNVADGYIYYQGCEYEATGVIVCQNDKTICAATWKPTGTVADKSDTESTPQQDSGDTGSGSGSDSGNTGEGGSGSGGSTGGSSSGGSGTSISKSDMTAAVNDGVRSAAPAVADSVRDSLTENDTSSDDKTNADSITQTNISRLEDNLNNAARGAGRFADPDGGGKAFGNGASEMDNAAAVADSQLSISKDGHGASWDSFLNEAALRPAIPTGNGCSPFVMFPGTLYQMQIDCDKLTDIKSVLAWVMYCLTFWYAFTEITTLLRGNK